MALKAVLVRGLGAVSPAGWNVASLRQALESKAFIAPAPLPRPGQSRPIQVRCAPPLTARPPYFAHARLRRTSPIAQYTVAAALEALGADTSNVTKGVVRLGIILCVMAGCVNYSRRFYDETLRDPALASPLIFPETVFNAPASHLAALLGCTQINCTLVGDPGTFLAGLAMAANWLQQERVDACVIIGAEEADWLVSDAFRRFDRDIVLSEGAGVLYLRYAKPERGDVELTCVTNAHSYGPSVNRAAAAQAMRTELAPDADDYLLSDGTQGRDRADAAELAAWRGWNGPRISVKHVLGEGLAASSAWQCVAAVDALKSNRSSRAAVSVVGCNQQAIGAEFVLRHAQV